jgi:hypothetical protein
MAFVGRLDRGRGPDPLEWASAQFAGYDLVVANLESPLTHSNRSIPGKCTLRGNPNWAPRLYQAGVHVLSLANNHLMDHGRQGLLDTIDHLTQAGIQWIGAGRNSQEACNPLIVEAAGQKIALLARSSVVVASPSYATPATPGVARFNLQETIAAIKDCRSQADLVLLCLHWGLEHYQYPAPSQRTLARRLIEAGADIVIGHHPHVLQGIEAMNGGVVAYSLGNFLFDHFSWRFTGEDSQEHEQEIRLSSLHLSSCILAMTLAKGKVPAFEAIPSRIGDDTVIRLDPASSRQSEMRHLCKPFQYPMYGVFWKLYAIQQEWRLRFLPLIKGKLTWRELRKIRPRHFLQLIRTLRRAVGITREKSTNPYE